MAKNSRKTYYWDACTFIAWLNGGRGHPKDVIAGLDEIAKDISENRANLCTSVNTKTEILQGKLIPDQKTRLENLFKRRNVIAINVDGRIADLASDIRNYYNEKGVKIKTTDAQHLATAIIYGADEFHTLDGDGERKRPSDLLRLNGDVAGRSLHIRVPVAIQGSLLAGIGPLELDASKSVNDSGSKSEEAAQPSTPQIQGSSDRPAEDETGKIEGEGRRAGKKPNHN